jgi:hypothetical protein
MWASNNMCYGHYCLVLERQFFRLWPLVLVAFIWDSFVLHGKFIDCQHLTETDPYLLWFIYM